MIQNAVEFTDQERQLVIEMAGDPPTDPASWGTEELNGIRLKIKHFYIAEQNERCCYCDLEYPSQHGWVWSVEHVISRHLQPRWTFEPRNLAASCHECNGGKGKSEVRRNPNIVGFPDQGTRYKIVHPHFDNWDDHLRRLGQLYIALDEKGSFTINCCNLFRFAERKLNRRNPIRDKRFDESVGQLFFAESLNDAEPEIARIRAIIKQERDQGSADDNVGPGDVAE
jgi:hypothetical protein